MLYAFDFANASTLSCCAPTSSQSSLCELARALDSCLCMLEAGSLSQTRAAASSPLVGPAPIHGAHGPVPGAHPRRASLSEALDDSAGGTGGAAGGPRLPAHGRGISEGMTAGALRDLARVPSVAELFRTV
jgi:hypothetical protein